MKVAIIGAGVSGLACAYELERNGIKPNIFEYRNKIGQSLNIPVVYQNLFGMHFGDPLKYFKKQYGLELVPLQRLHEEIMVGPNKTVTARGNLGYIFKRGIEAISVENQIASKINAPMEFNSKMSSADVHALKKEFDYVVISTGDYKFAEDMRVWNSTFTAHSRIAFAAGHFKTESVRMWLNTKYAGNTFGYIIPQDFKRACIMLIVNDIKYNELNRYWNEFMENDYMKANRNQYTILEAFDRRHVMGYAYPPRIDNVYFTGDLAGMADDFIGFGTINAIESGIMAARSIISGKDYEALIRPAFKRVRKIHEMRLAINTMGNDDFDKLLSIIGLPVVKQLIYNNPLAKACQGSALARLYRKSRMLK